MELPHIRQQETSHLQLHKPALVELLTMSLGEEQNADQRLNQSGISTFDVRCKGFPPQ
jgi:hypothetical protein